MCYEHIPQFNISSIQFVFLRTLRPLLVSEQPIPSRIDNKSRPVDGIVSASNRYGTVGCETYLFITLRDFLSLVISRSISFYVSFSTVNAFDPTLPFLFLLIFILSGSRLE